MLSKIFVNHKFQSRGNKHHRLLAVRKKGYMRSQESSLTASIEYVALAYYCLSYIFFLPYIRLTPAETVATSTMPVEASSCSSATFWF